MPPIPAPKLSKLRAANKAEVAEFFGVSLAAVDAWIRRGCPAVQTGSKGIPWLFDLLEVATWRIRGPSPADPAAGIDPEQMSPKERLDYYKGTRERMAMERDAGTLIPADQVTKAWTDQINVAKGRFLALPQRIAPLLIGIGDLREIERRIADGIVSVLEELAGVSDG